MTKILFVPTEGPPLDATTANDLLSDAWSAQADLVAVPVERLTDGFLDLSTRIAGEVIQKFTNYRMRLAFIGDISARIEASHSLRDFVYESNKGQQVWFLNDRAALDAKLAAQLAGKG
ncbi:DUF4180 domain-containing protein [Caulobacter sp.]|uniref:DUF4180 domain-containing protein n=1 Tax=Caulobacter sp. TaxID=78 RepID=UPI001B1F741D|nr:DUF4180 domain-containing protein [Caulobacter sp.]MBO9543411.1 DUF4180 domain-containing protein [Caulobacter sp.]